MKTRLQNLRLAILATDGFEQVELFSPRDAYQEEGALVSIVSQNWGEIESWNKNDWGETIPVDLILDRARVDDFDVLFIPGGVLNPDRLRMDSRAVAFIRDFFQAGKPVAAICHGPQLLIEADVVRGRTLTSWPSIKTDLKNAGANWVNEKVVQDGNLVTSRGPDDIPVFNARTIEFFEKAMVGAIS